MTQPRRLVAFMKYSARSASTRQRLLQFVPALDAGGWQVEVRPLLDDDYLQRFSEGRSPKASAVATAYLRRLATLARGEVADVTWVHSEVFPWLPGIFEAQVARGGARLVYDCDDAIFHQYDLNARPLVRRLLGRKLQPLLARADLALCGSDYLRDYARRYCKRTKLLPTVLDTDHYRPAPARSTGGQPVIGWLGSPSTWRYVETLFPVLSAIADEGLARVVAIGAGPGASRFPGLEHRPWIEADELGQLQRFDLGIMPLTDDPWSRGKCGYKLIQYAACGLPAVGTPVGVNADILLDGVSGHHATSLPEWDRALRSLLSDPGLRARMGAAGREHMIRNYSLAAHAPRLVRFLDEIAPPRLRT